jgi:hypothetical protein
LLYTACNEDVWLFRAWGFGQLGHETFLLCTWLAKGKINKGLGPGGLIDYLENVAHLVVYSILFDNAVPAPAISFHDVGFEVEGPEIQGLEWHVRIRAHAIWWRAARE